MGRTYTEAELAEIMATEFGSGIRKLEESGAIAPGVVDALQGRQYGGDWADGMATYLRDLVSENSNAPARARAELLKRIENATTEEELDQLHAEVTGKPSEQPAWQREWQRHRAEEAARLTRVDTQEQPRAETAAPRSYPVPPKLADVEGMPLDDFERVEGLLVAQLRAAEQSRA